MKPLLGKQIGRLVDALAWRGMHAIARRQEARHTPQLPAAQLPAARPLAAHMFPPPAEPALQSLSGAAWKPRGKIWQSDFAFPSASPSPHAQNNTVYVRAYAPERASHNRALPRPAVLVLHGLMNFTTAAYAPFLRALVEAGAGAYVLELPYHHRRAPAGSLSGDLFHTSDLALTQHAVQQAVADVRVLVRYLRRDAEAPQIGVLGFSLGAWIGGLVACCEPDLDFALLGMPPSNLNELVWRSALGAQLVRRFAAQGWSPETTAEFYAALDPLSYQPLLPPEHIQLYAAEFDTLIALEQVYALQRAWGRPNLRTYPHGHLTIMLSRQLHRDFRADFMRQLSHTVAAIAEQETREEEVKTKPG
ncbi:MAG: alpha/beta hydrolase family protein [candidate division KSB1 bacterium]